MRIKVSLASSRVRAIVRRKPGIVLSYKVLVTGGLLAVFESSLKEGLQSGCSESEEDPH